MSSCGLGLMGVPCPGPPSQPCLFQALTALLSDDSKFGFIVIDGSGALFGTLQGNTREVLHKFTVDLPKKHGNTLGASVLGWGVRVEGGSLACGGLALLKSVLPWNLTAEPPV